jgi:sulfur carrier protein
MNLTINGKKETIADNGGITVVELLKLKKVEMPDMVSVQLNGSILNREEFETKQVKDNDEVEFLYFMGGGSL